MTTSQVFVKQVGGFIVKMRASIVVSSFLIAGALGKPIKRDYVYEDVTILTTVTVYAANIVTESIPTVTVSKAVGTTQIEAAIAIPTGEISNSSAVHYRHHHKWNVFKAKPSVASNASTAPVLTSASTPPATTTAISTFQLHAFVTNSSSFKEVSSTSMVTPEEPASTSKVTTLSSDEASSVSTPAPEEPVSTPIVSTTTPETTPEPANHSQEPTLEDAETAESDGSPYSDGVHLLTTINKWRKIYNLPLLRWNHQLELNALKTGTDGAGYYQNHELNPGTMAQVITPGMSVKYGGDLGGDSPFELSYVAWLCESSSDAELKSDGKDQCKLVDDNLHMYYDDKGHYDILTQSSYTKIGCAFADNPNSGNDTPYQGLWVCDLS